MNLQRHLDQQIMIVDNNRMGGHQGISQYVNNCCRKNMKYQKLSLESCLDLKVSSLLRSPWAIYFDKATLLMQYVNEPLPPR
ncbi:hypothetical protein SADUNF_Sadunf01G0116500 [Salix dunnii]|uniref:Uncharacterized protein n=1 Tax=Salix dunnii TaxID=1413687 RepID=A0A835TME3_9ROSI|nr:hypothetical protein SADUNF_Sadunf01G0116500 [Salix dunnii]